MDMKPFKSQVTVWFQKHVDERIQLGVQVTSFISVRKEK